MNKPPNKALLGYLTWINPIVALIVLYCCSWSALGGTLKGIEAGTPAAGSPLEDPFSMYFIGKGIFCSTSLFLFGIFLRSYLIDSSERSRPQPSHD